MKLSQVASAKASEEDRRVGQFIKRLTLLGLNQGNSTLVAHPNFERCVAGGKTGEMEVTQRPNAIMHIG